MVFRETKAAGGRCGSFVGVVVYRLFLATCMPGLVLCLGCGGPTVPSTVGPLRVGITNHPPYSEANDDVVFGIDVDLAKDLGVSLDRQVVFVPTTWASLVARLVAGEFDIALGGVHVTPQRRQAAQFSRSYLYLGKHAVVRCSEVARFTRSEDIDRLGVEVFATLGGASALFVHERFPQASVLQSASAHEALRRLARGEGDVVFGDTLLTSALTRRDPRLCIGLGGAVFGAFSIAILMRSGSDLQGPINAWVTARLDDGTIDRIVENHAPFGAASTRP